MNARTWTAIVSFEVIVADDETSADEYSGMISHDKMNNVVIFSGTVFLI